MPANTSPIFTLTPNVGWGTPADGNGGTAGPLKTANTARDGTGTVLTVFTAGSNGSFVESVKFTSVGNCTATVARIFLNNGSTNATIANNSFIQEFSLPTTTASATAALPDFVVPLNINIPAGYKINVVLGTTVSDGYFVSVKGGDY